MKTIVFVLGWICAWPGEAFTRPCPEDEKKAVPLYTNEDLRRFSQRREATAPASPVASASPAPDPSARSRGEAYWRREAQRLRDRLLPLRSSVEDLRLKIEERRQAAGGRSPSDPRLRAWERRLRSLEDRIQEWESRLEDRARREGALPGWLR